MSVSLYEMSKNYVGALNFITDPENEIDQQTIVDTLEALDGDIDEKILNVAKFIISIENESEGIALAEKRMKARREAIEKKAASLREYLLENLISTGKAKVNDQFISVGTAKTPVSVHILDESLIPAFFIKTKETSSVDKALIKELGGCPGAEIKAGIRLAIK